MKTAKKFRLAAAIIVAAALAAVIVDPSTGWIVRRQVAMTFRGLLPANAMKARAAQAEARVDRLGATYPGDVPLQLALAHRANGPLRKQGPDDATVLARLNTLEARNPNQGAFFAATLRILCRDRMTLDERDEQKLLEPESSKARSEWKKGTPVDAATLAEWESAASAGEQADPTNAFFPYMHAVGLFAAHQDDRACDEIMKAGALRRYDDYVGDDVVGGWEIADARNGGESGSVPKILLLNSISLPHYKVMRAGARLAMVKAVEYELSGQTEAGFALRHAVRQVGALMRVDGSTIISNLAGEVITGATRLRPGGEPAIERGNPQNGEQHAALRVARYEAYLTRIGHAEEIASVDHDEAARKSIQAIGLATEDIGPSSASEFAALFIGWGAGVMVLGNAFSLVLICGVAVLLAQAKQVWGGFRSNPAAKIGVFGTLGTLAVLMTATSLLGAAPSGNLYGYFTMLASIAMLAVVVWNARRASGGSKARVGPAVGSWAAGVAVTVLVVAFVWVLRQGIVEYVSGTPEWSGIAGTDANSLGDTQARLIRAVVSTAALLIALLGFAIGSWVRGATFSGRIVRGLGACALPTVYVFSLLYVSSVVWTARRETRMLNELPRSVRHEGRFHAELLGRPWPALDAPRK